MRRPGPTSALPRAMTMLELMIVVALLAILAAIATPKFLNIGQQARSSTLQFNLALMQAALEYHSTEDGIHGHPPAINPAWFRSGMLPDHPENSFNVPSVEVVEQPLFDHPEDKVLTHSSHGAYWYNAGNGIIRARVADQGTLETTLAFYNFVNRASESSLGDYAQGGLW
jgi:prepilin-type N-terminal cleavage/methylation domain-containing protein